MVAARAADTRRVRTLLERRCSFSDVVILGKPRADVELVALMLQHRLLNVEIGVELRAGGIDVLDLLDQQEATGTDLVSP